MVLYEDDGCYLPLEPVDTAVRQRFICDNTCIVHKISCCKIIRTINDDVIFFENIDYIIGIQPLHVGFYFNIRIQIINELFCGFGFWLSDIASVDYCLWRLLRSTVSSSIIPIVLCLLPQVFDYRCTRPPAPMHNTFEIAVFFVLSRLLPQYDMTRVSSYLFFIESA